MAISRRSSKAPSSPIKLPPINTSQSSPRTSSRHRCPHKQPGVLNKGNGQCVLSEYTNRYIRHPLEPTKSLKPVQEPHVGDGPMADETTHRVDYVPHPLEKPFVHQSEQYVPPEGHIDSLTTHKRDYTPKAAERTKPAKPDYTRRTPGKFEADPTYKRDYRKWSIPRTEKITHDPGYEPPSAPFEGDATYTTDYTRHPIALRQSMKPAENAKLSDEPFDGKTGYREEFIKHKLPPRELKEKPKYSPNKAALDGLSNYMKDYTPKDLGKQDSCKPPPKPYQSDAPFEDDTTHKVDYKRWATQRPFQHQPDAYVKPEGDFYHDTTTHTDYTRKPMARSKLIKPEGGRRTPGKFDGTTNYVTDFRKWTPAEPPRKTMKSEYTPPTARFEGQTNYHDEYIPHRQPPRQNLKPVENAKLSDQPFENRTGYRDEYIKHPLTLRQQKEKPVWQPNPATMDGLSNYMKDYTPKEAGKQASCRPDPAPYQSDAPFDADTTHKVDYKKWQASRPYQHQPEQYVQPEGTFDHNTTTHVDYTKKPIERSKPLKPEGGRRTPGKFDGTTNYKTDFRKWSAGERPKVTMKSEYSPPEAKFEGITNYQDEYIKHPGQLRQSMKPADRGYNSDAPFESGTEYRQEYTKKKPPICPAAIIEKLPPAKTGYQFAMQDPQGHKWYEPVSSSVIELPSTSNLNNANLNRQLTALSVA